MQEICKDLEQEQDALDAMVADLPEKTWDAVTPFYGWTIRDEISHVAYFDNAGRAATEGKEAFAAHSMKLFEGVTDEDSVHRKVHDVGRGMTKDLLLAWWRGERSNMNKALAALQAKDRLPWYGPSMSARSFATARLMETWAHGQDVADTLRIQRPAAGRLIHVAQIGFITFGWSFANRGLAVPEGGVRLELSGPSGEPWIFGQEDASNRVAGPALEFCLVATQRRNVADTKLEVSGEGARQWMGLAQTFAGPPAQGPLPGQRVIS